MNKKILVVFVSLSVIAMLALPTSAVSATKPTTVNGTISVNIFSVDEDPIKETKGGILITQVTIPEETWDGAIIGECIYEGRWIYHKDPSPPPKHSSGVYTFSEATVTVDGKTETGGLVLKSTANPKYPYGLWTVVEATGGLAGLHGQGTFDFVEWDFPNMILSYTGNLHFDP